MRERVLAYVTIALIAPAFLTSAVADAIQALLLSRLKYSVGGRGYYLIGTTAARAGVFQSVRWSTEFTLADHLDRCREADWSVAFLPKLHDIDTWDDWQSYLLRTGRQSGEPHTDAGGDRPYVE